MSKCHSCVSSTCACFSNCYCRGGTGTSLCPCERPRPIAFPSDKHTSDLLTSIGDLGYGKPTISESISDREFKDKIHSIAEEAFLKAFNFAYDGAKTQPPDLSGGIPLKSHHQLVGVPQGNIDQAKSCFTDILTEGNPEWFVDQVVTDIGFVAQDVFQETTANTWKETKINSTYQGPSGGSINVRAVVLHANVNVDEENGSGVHVLVYYLGVYYGPSLQE